MLILAQDERTDGRAGGQADGRSDGRRDGPTDEPVGGRDRARSVAWNAVKITSADDQKSWM